MRELGMFAKFWQPGMVKTRLAAALGEPSAAHLHRACVAALAARFSEVADRRVLCFTLPEHEPEFAALAGPCWRVAPQCAGDLGQRMRHYFAAAFAAGADRVVLIGSDSPTLPAAYLDEAFDQLADVPIVLGPSDDGGYYLIGLSREVPEIFCDIAWGTSEVWLQTVGRLKAAGQGYHELPRWYDVDTFDDLKRLRRELTETPSASADLMALRDAVDALPGDAANRDN